MTNDIFRDFLNNKILMTTIVAWIVAQTVKVGIGVLKERKFDFRWFIGTGGMPSSHTAGAVCLATSLGLEYGFDSALFALAASFAIVVMFDAQSARRATGKQARILNKIMDDIYWKGRIHELRLRELIGHTPVEVIAGIFLGALIAIIAN